MDMFSIFLKWGKRILFGLGILLILLAGTAYIIARLMEDDVTDIVIRELNRNLITTIQASNIRLSFLRKFPKASVEFRDVVALSPRGFHREAFQGEGDTLFRIKRIFLEFNLREVITRNVRLQNVHALGGKVWILTSADQTNNYIFWKKSLREDTTTTRINLQQVKLNDIHIIYDDRSSGVKAKAHLEKVSFNGNFSGERNLLRTSGQIHSDYLSLDSSIWIRGKDLNLDLEMQILKDQIDFSAFRIDAGSVHLTGIGKYLMHGPARVDFRIESGGAPVHEICSLLPASFGTAVQTYSIRGNAGVKVTILGKARNPAIRVDFDLKNGFIQYPGRPGLDDLSAGGYYLLDPARGDSSAMLDISRFSANLGEGEISGKVQIRNLDRPYFNFGLKFSAGLNDLQKLALADTVYELRGKAEGSLSGSGLLGSFSNPDLKLLAGWNYLGSVKIQGGYVNDYKHHFILDKAEGKIFISDKLRLEDFNITQHQNKYRVNVEIPAFSRWLFLPGQSLHISGHVVAPELNYSSLEGKSGDQKTTPAPFVFPDSLYLDLELAIGKLTAGKFMASGITGKMTYQPFMFVIHSLHAQAMNGGISGGAVLLQRFNKDILFRTQSRMDNLDIKNMFVTFNNFGQTVLTDKNLKGTISGSVNMQAEWDPYLHVKQESILAETSFEIDNGELIQFEPMKGLSKFIEVSELEHIYFSKLQNEVFIRNRTITIPSMDINSSAFNIKGSGEHTFDNVFSYKIQVSMSEVLAGKARKARKENEEFGIVEPEDKRRMSLYLLVSGNMDDYKVKYDARNALRGMQSNFSKEKTQLRSILQDEFNKRGNDSLPPLDGNRKTGKFRLEFEDGNVKTTKEDRQQKNTGTKNKNGKFNIEWDADSVQPPK